MASRYRYFIIFLCLILWPLNLFVFNTVPDFFSYLIPAILLVISYILYLKSPKYYLIPILLIGIFEKKLVLLPVIFCLTELITKFSKRTLIFLLIALTFFGLFFKNFKGQTVFNKDYEAEQLVLRNIHLYPNVISARLFQNKAKIYFDKLDGNFFALIDPNNYFFAFHPRPIPVDNQNLYKFPFFALPFLFVGLYYFGKNPDKKFVLILFISCIISLTVLKNFDRNDFILWLPVSLIIINGVNILAKRQKFVFGVISILLIAYSIPEFVRDYLIYKLK